MGQYVEAPSAPLWWHSSECQPVWTTNGVDQLAQHIRAPLYIVQHPTTTAYGVAPAGQVYPAGAELTGHSFACVGIVPALYPEWLGDRGFCAQHGVRFPYIAGAMARGIASTDIVISMSKAGMLAFFGSAGLSLEQVQVALATIKSQLTPQHAWGCNLIHTPDEPALEAAIVDTFIAEGVSRMSASAFTGITPALATFAYKGIYLDDAGQIQRRHFVFAKISRPETAAPFMRPAPKKIVQQLLNAGVLTPEEAALAEHLPIAEDITVEADSGGHTDGQILTALFPSILQLRDQIVSEQQYSRPIRVGAAGGLGTPSAVAAAFSMGAAYVLTGSVNQSCVEAGISPAVKQLLAEVRTGDVAMAPCADMFEAGVKVQVLKRRSLYAQRAGKLYEIYKGYDSLDAIPDPIRQSLEKQIFQQTIDAIWEQTLAFFTARKPAEIEKAERNPKHKMALVFRWYLGNSSRWPIVGDEARVTDYQVWCGPAMASFNDWVAGSELEHVANRTVVQVAYNLLEGACQVTRAQQLRSFGLPVSQSAFDYRPRHL